VLGADDRIGLGLDDWHARSAEIRRRPQPRRVAAPGVARGRRALAPGWANARIEDGPDVDYQADQTGVIVIAYLAQARRGVDGEARRDSRRRARRTRRDPRGRRPPVVCQNAWEDSAGRFAHTTATFLEAYSELALHGDGLDASARSIGTGTRMRPAATSTPPSSRTTSPHTPATKQFGCTTLSTTSGCPNAAVTRSARRPRGARPTTGSTPRRWRWRARAPLVRRGGGDGEAEGHSGAVDAERLDRLVSHVETVVGLAHTRATRFPD